GISSTDPSTGSGQVFRRLTQISFVGGRLVAPSLTLRVLFCVVNVTKWPSVCTTYPSDVTEWRQFMATVSYPVNVVIGDLAFMAVPLGQATFQDKNAIYVVFDRESDGRMTVLDVGEISNE